MKKTAKCVKQEAFLYSLHIYISGITLMLAYSIFLLMLTEYTPKSGEIPDLGKHFEIYSMNLPDVTISRLILRFQAISTNNFQV